jgi:hypothetical protein
MPLQPGTAVTFGMAFTVTGNASLSGNTVTSFGIGDGYVAGAPSSGAMTGNPTVTSEFNSVTYINASTTITNYAGATHQLSSSNSGSVSQQSNASFSILRYEDVSEALSELHSFDVADDWRLDESVYRSSVQVAAALFDKNIPTPTVFSHGPKSVVFNWSGPDNSNLYLTVSATRLSALVSTVHSITYRAELVGPSFNHANGFFSALGFASYLGEPLVLTGSKDR